MIPIDDRTWTIKQVESLNVVLHICAWSGVTESTMLHTIIIVERPSQHLSLTAGTFPYDVPKFFTIFIPPPSDCTV